MFNFRMRVFGDALETGELVLSDLVLVLMIGISTLHRKQLKKFGNSVSTHSISTTMVQNKLMLAKLDIIRIR